MKRITLILLSAFISVLSLAQNVQASDYALYSTQNMWTFLELETSTGRVWQVQYYVNGDSYRFKVELNGNSLVPVGETAAPGRFSLAPTQNMYNFLLLDTYSGRVWQIQWSIEAKNRGVVDEIKEITAQNISGSDESRYDAVTKSGPYNVTLITTPVPSYKYWSFTLEGGQAFPKKKYVYLEGNDIDIKCLYRHGNRYIFDKVPDGIFRMMIVGDECGEILITK